MVQVLIRAQTHGPFLSLYLLFSGHRANPCYLGIFAYGQTEIRGALPWLVGQPELSLCFFERVSTDASVFLQARWKRNLMSKGGASSCQVPNLRYQQDQIGRRIQKQASIG